MHEKHEQKDMRPKIWASSTNNTTCYKFCCANEEMYFNNYAKQRHKYTKFKKSFLNV
jgi:hypothetical protein